MDIADLKRLMPHRYPMQLIDRVDEIVPGESLVATKTVTVNELCYAFVSEGVDNHEYPATLLVESWSQAAGVLIAQRRPNPDVLTTRSVNLFAAINDIEFIAPVVPGDVLRHHVRAQMILSDGALLEGQTVVDGATVMRVGQIVIMSRPPATVRAGSSAPVIQR